MLGGGFFPESEVKRVALLLLPVESAGGGEEVFYVAAGKFAIIMVAVILLHIEIYRSVAFVGISGAENLFHIFYLLYDMAGGVRLDARG